MNGGHRRRDRSVRDAPSIEVSGTGASAELERIPSPKSRRAESSSRLHANHCRAADALRGTAGARHRGVRDFDRPVSEAQIGIGVLNNYTAFGMPMPNAAG